MSHLLKPYVDKQTYQEQKIVSIMCLSPEQYLEIQNCIQMTLTKAELMLPFCEPKFKENHLNSIEKLKTIEKILQ